MNASTIRLLNALKGVKGSGTANQWSAFCPSHDDKARSLSVAEDRDTTLVKCHAGCTAEKIMAAVRMSVSDLFSDEPAQRRTSAVTERYSLTAEWTFKLHDGSTAVHKRFDSPSGKRFTWERNGEKGMGGFPLDQVPLYGIEALTDDTDAVIVTEGEKARDAIADIMPGVAVVATVCGAASIPGDEQLLPLARRGVWLWPDHDAPGYEHMNRIAQALVRLSNGENCPFWIAWGGKPKGDAADAVAMGIDIGELIGNAELWHEGIGAWREAPLIPRTARVL